MGRQNLTFFVLKEKRFIALENAHGAAVRFGSMFAEPAADTTRLNSD
jgi:hypothetical protein